MLDLYTILVPLFAGLSLLSLVVLKLAIKDNATLIRIYDKNQEVYQQNNQSNEHSPTQQTLKYLLINFTPIEMFAVRRAKYKLSLLLSLAIISLATYSTPSPFAFVATGTVVYFTYFLLTMGLTHAD